MFTVPGDNAGCIDFQSVTDVLAKMDYNDWVVVEAEQDPANAEPRVYSKIGYDHIVEVCNKSGLTVDNSVQI